MQHPTGHTLDRPRFGRHDLAVVVDVCISELMSLFCDCGSERPRVGVRLLISACRGLSGIGWKLEGVVGRVGGQVAAVHNEVGATLRQIGHNRLQRSQVAMDIRDHRDPHNPSMPRVMSGAARPQRSDTRRVPVRPRSQVSRSVRRALKVGLADGRVARASPGA
jgi:hypothetical protein